MKSKLERLKKYKIKREELRYINASGGACEQGCCNTCEHFAETWGSAIYCCLECKYHCRQIAS